MLQWAKQQLADVAGTEEPIYGPGAIKTVSGQAKQVPYTELTRDHLQWTLLDSTCVETQTFYVTADNGHQAMVQVIYNNVAGLKVTTQLTTKIFYPTDSHKPNLWSSDQLSDCGHDATNHSFHADNCSIKLSDDASSYTLTSKVNPNTIVDLVFRRAGPAFVIGKDGTTTYGLDQNKPRGFMKHAFWPRCRVEGTITTPAGPIDLSGLGMFIPAIQGMKPHHAAARWNFVNFQGPTYSAVMMEFTTPPSYGCTTVNVGGIVTDDKVVYAGATNTATHTAVQVDEQNGWSVPTAAAFTWGDKDAAEPLASLAGDLSPRADKVDIMAEVPKFVKQIVASAAGTKPYIYQFNPTMSLKVNIDGKEIVEKGRVYAEATFITKLP